MANPMIANAKTYTDLQGLDQLKYAAHNANTRHALAQQFESMLMQMMVHSMRAANAAFGDELSSNNQMQMYQDLFDKQLSLTVAGNGNGVGLTAMIEKNLSRGMLKDSAAASPVLAMGSPPATPATVISKPPVTPPVTSPVTSPKFATHAAFVQGLWSTAKEAAATLGLAPEVLLAQAALETDWGQKIVAHVNGDSSHNLFNIKATTPNNAVHVATLEQKNGVLTRQSAAFRSYTSFKESFMDYARLLLHDGRYASALAAKGDPAHFFKALQQHGYATDPNYANKVMKIFSSQPFQHMVSMAKVF